MSPVILKPPQLLMYRQQCGADLTAGVCLGCGWERTQIHPGNVAGSISGILAGAVTAPRASCECGKKAKFSERTRQCRSRLHVQHNAWPSR